MATGSQFAPPRYIAVEGPLRVGKSTLARILAERLHARLIADRGDNPHLADFYAEKPGAAFRSQMHFLLTRYLQLRDLALQHDPRRLVCDYLFEKDRVFASLNLSAPELKVYEQYFELETLLASTGTVDVLAHVDRVKYLGQRLPEHPIDLYRDLVEAAVRSGVAVEVSSAGLRHPIAEVYPAPALLEMCRSAGLDITLASDGHRPEQAGGGHDQVVVAARSAGYGHTARFRARRRRLEPIIPLSKE